MSAALAGKKIAWLMVVLALGGWLSWPAGAQAKEPGRGKAMKKAILLVTFGTSLPKAQAVFDLIDVAVKKAHPGLEVRWAYTSKKIRLKVAKQQGKEWLSPEEALARLMDEGFTHLAVQSLHVMPGQEFHQLASVVKGFGAMAEGFSRITLGQPLCSTTDDLKAVSAALVADLPPQRKKNEAVCFMGHGTHHPAGVVYPALAYLLAQADPLLFMGTVEGYPMVEDLKAQLIARGVHKAYLVPFMTVAGDHAVNDMAGDEPDSWKSVLTQAASSACR